MTSAWIAAALGGAFAGLALAEAWHLEHVPPGPRRAGADHRDRRASWTSRRAVERRAWAPLAASAIAGWGLVGGLGFAAGPLIALIALRAARARQARRSTHACERGAGGLARSLADAVRAGHSVRGALHAAARDHAVPAEVRAATIDADAALQRGASLPDVLHHLARRGGPQLVLLCAVVALHAERGGRLPHVLDRLADDADRAVRLDEERASATAQARATVRTVAALPLLALAGGQLLGGDLLGAVAGHPLSLGLLLVGLALEVAAVVLSQRLVAAAA